jgi:uncharacterized membrane protein YdjX (TVP38/TMEM64 family)
MKAIIYFMITCALSTEAIFDGLIVQHTPFTNFIIGVGVWGLYFLWLEKRNKRRRFH